MKLFRKNVYVKYEFDRQKPHKAVAYRYTEYKLFGVTVYTKKENF